MSSSMASACSSSSSALAPTDEIADEVKVFRTQDVEDAMDIASSSAELNADKKDLALEADIESQAEPICMHAQDAHGYYLTSTEQDTLYTPHSAVSQRPNPLQSTCFPFPSPSYDFLFPLFMPSPLSPIQAYAASAAAAAYAVQNPLLKLASSMSPNVASVFNANAAHQLAAAAAIIKHSPSYTQLGGSPWNPLAPPAFGIGSPVAGNLLQQMSQVQGAQAFGAQLAATQRNQMPQFGGGLPQSPMASVSTGFNGISLAAEHQKAKQHQRAASNLSLVAPHAQMSTPKASKSKSAPSSASKHHGTNRGGEPLGNQKDKAHVKKPCNAFMWFMKMNRGKLLAQEDCQQKQSALLNQQLGKIWQSMSKKDQQEYYDMAAREREEHQQNHPNWSARENYRTAIKNKKKRREKSLENNEQKKCRARFGVENQAQWCKHCRRKKRCLNVRDADSPVVSSTTSASTSGHHFLSHLHQGQAGSYDGHAAGAYGQRVPSQHGGNALHGAGGQSGSSIVSSPYSSGTASSNKRSESAFSSDSIATNNCTPPPSTQATPHGGQTLSTNKAAELLGDANITPRAAIGLANQPEMQQSQQSTSSYQRPQPIPESFQHMLSTPFGGMGYPTASVAPLPGHPVGMSANPTLPAQLNGAASPFKH